MKTAVTMKSVRLSPVDHIFTGSGSYPVEFVLRFGQRLDSGPLNQALKKVLPIFWPIAGRLAPQDKNSFQVRWDGGIPEIEVIDCANQNFPDQRDPQKLLALSIPVESVEGKPLCGFRLYQFRNESALVVNISHCLVDGYSFFYFLSQWADECKGLDWRARIQRFLARPDHRRSLLVPKDQQGEAIIGSDQQCFAKVGLSYLPKAREFGKNACQWRFIDFSHEQIERVRAKANVKLSSNDILSALLVKQLLEEGGFFTDRARIATAFDYRRILPELSPRYFGNAVRAAAFEVSTAQLKTTDEVAIASSVRAATSSIDVVNSRESLRYLEGARLSKSMGLPFIQALRVADEQCGLLLTNLSRIPMSSFDFGSGPPQDVIALTPAPRSAVIVAKSGGYTIRVSPPN
jgi:hypothetical protein